MLARVTSKEMERMNGEDGSPESLFFFLLSLTNERTNEEAALVDWFDVQHGAAAVWEEIEGKGGRGL